MGQRELCVSYFVGSAPLRCDFSEKLASLSEIE